MVQTYSRFAVMVSFAMNRNYIAANLCENRSKPRSCCKGSCVLKKELQKSDTEQNSPKNAQQNEKFELVHFTPISRFQIRTSEVRIVNQYYVPEAAIIHSACLGSLFKPPRS